MPPGHDWFEQRLGCTSDWLKKWREVFMEGTRPPRLKCPYGLAYFFKKASKVHVFYSKHQTTRLFRSLAILCPWPFTW